MTQYRIHYFEFAANPSTPRRDKSSGQWLCYPYRPKQDDREEGDSPPAHPSTLYGVRAACQRIACFMDKAFSERKRLSFVSPLVNVDYLEAARHVISRRHLPQVFHRLLQRLHYIDIFVLHRLLLRHYIIRYYISQISYLGKNRFLKNAESTYFDVSFETLLLQDEISHNLTAVPTN